MMSLEMGALGTIGAATGAYYLGPSIVAGAKASWPYVVAGGTAAYKFGEASAYKALDFYSRFSRQVNFAFDYITGFWTPVDPQSPGSVAAYGTQKIYDHATIK